MALRSRVFLHGFTVVSNREVARDVVRMELRSPELAATIRPGQFINIEVPGDARHLLRIPLSFASASAETGTVELIYAVVGEGTRRLSHMGQGQTSTALGPGGNGWACPEAGRTLLVAGGAGAPPIIAAAGMLAERGLRFDVILGARSADRLWGQREARCYGAGQLSVTTDDGSYGLRGTTTDAMARLLKGRGYDLVMSCGPAPMMAGVARLAAERNIPCQVSVERLMACGFGVCSCCNVALATGGNRSCCMDGPVFDADEVAW